MNETMLLAADSLAPFEEAKGSPEPGAGGAVQALRQERTVEMTTKTCPVCSARVFADMDTCFNCMYLFGSNPALEKKAAFKALPEKIPVLDASEESPPDTPVVSEDEGDPELPRAPAKLDDEHLLAELLVELHGFLGQFLLDRGIDLKEL